MSDKFIITSLDVPSLKEICHNCGSKSVKDGCGYMQWIYFHNPERCRLSLVPGVGFWFGTVSKKHFRLIEFAVHKNHQGEGYGRALFEELCQYVSGLGLNKITLRTSMYESAINFWERIGGAKVVGMKKDDYELEIDLGA